MNIKSLAIPAQPAMWKMPVLSGPTLYKFGTNINHLKLKNILQLSWATLWGYYANV